MIRSRQYTYTYIDDTVTCYTFHIFTYVHIYIYVQNIKSGFVVLRCDEINNQALGILHKNKIPLDSHKPPPKRDC